MIHISKLSSKRVEKVEDVVNIGDMVEVEVIKINIFIKNHLIKY